MYNFNALHSNKIVLHLSKLSTYIIFSQEYNILWCKGLGSSEVNWLTFGIPQQIISITFVQKPAYVTHCLCSFKTWIVYSFKPCTHSLSTSVDSSSSLCYILKLTKTLGLKHFAKDCFCVVARKFRNILHLNCLS